MGKGCANDGYCTHFRLTCLPACFLQISQERYKKAGQARKTCCSDLVQLSAKLYKKPKTYMTVRRYTFLSCNLVLWKKKTIRMQSQANLLLECKRNNQVIFTTTKKTCQSVGRATMQSRFFSTLKDLSAKMFKKHCSIQVTRKKYTSSKIPWYTARENCMRT